MQSGPKVFKKCKQLFLKRRNNCPSQFYGQAFFAEALISNIGKTYNYYLNTHRWTPQICQRRIIVISNLCQKENQHTKSFSYKHWRSMIDS